MGPACCEARSSLTLNLQSTGDLRSCTARCDSIRRPTLQPPLLPTTQGTAGDPVLEHLVALEEASQGTVKVYWDLLMSEGHPHGMPAPRARKQHPPATLPAC